MHEFGEEKKNMGQTGGNQTEVFQPGDTKVAPRNDKLTTDHNLGAGSLTSIKELNKATTTEHVPSLQLFDPKKIGSDTALAEATRQVPEKKKLSGEATPNVGDGDAAANPADKKRTQSDVDESRSSKGREAISKLSPEEQASLKTLLEVTKPADGKNRTALPNDVEDSLKKIVDLQFQGKLPCPEITGMNKTELAAVRGIVDGMMDRGKNADGTLDPTRGIKTMTEAFQNAIKANGDPTQPKANMKAVCDAVRSMTGSDVRYVDNAVDTSTGKAFPPFLQFDGSGRKIGNTSQLHGEIHSIIPSSGPPGSHSSVTERGMSGPVKLGPKGDDVAPQIYSSGTDTFMDQKPFDAQMTTRYVSQGAGQRQIDYAHSLLRDLRGR
jgi:hypothetical protein